MQPFRVELDLATNMVASDPIHLDGFLAALAVQQASGNIEAGETLPLDQSSGMWKASIFIAPTIWRDRMSYIRKADVWQTALDKNVAFSGGGNTLNTSSGSFKAYQFFRSTRQAPKAVAWGIGDINKVRALFDTALSLGPLARLGMGQINKVKVIEDDRANQYWKLRNLGALERGYHQGVGAIKPPYWKRTDHQEIWIPSRSVIRSVEAQLSQIMR